jgi:peroxiredoxin
MKDARIDFLLGVCDPIDGDALDGVEDDAVAHSARARIRGSRPTRTRGLARAAVGIAGFTALAALVIALFAAAPGRDAPAAQEPAAAGLIEPGQRERVPSFDLPMLVIGESHAVGWNLPRASPEIVAPHPLIITFTDDWCEPCQPDLAVLQELWTTRAVGDLAVLAVAGPSAGRTEAVRTWWARAGATFPLAVDAETAAQRAFDIPARPTTILIDRESRVAARFTGTLDRDALGRAVDALLAEPEPPGPTVPEPIPGPVPDSALPLSVFSLPAPAATPPAALAGHEGGVYAESIRLALESPSGRAVWVARGPGDTLVAAIAGPSGVTAVTADAAANALAQGAIGASGDDGAGPWYFGGIVPDGYTQVSGGGRTVSVRDNAFLFEGGAPFTRITLSGPAGTKTIG